MFKRTYLTFLAIFLCSCTAVNTFHHTGLSVDGRELVITAGMPERPYRSIAITQTSVYGLWLFGFIEILPARLDEAIRGPLAQEAERVGADAVINLKWYELQYPLGLKILSVLTVLSPQATIVTGELVEFVD